MIAQTWSESADVSRLETHAIEVDDIGHERVADMASRVWLSGARVGWPHFRMIVAEKSR